MDAYTELLKSGIRFRHELIAVLKALDFNHSKNMHNRVSKNKEEKISFQKNYNFLSASQNDISAIVDVNKNGIVNLHAIADRVSYMAINSIASQTFFDFLEVEDQYLDTGAVHLVPKGILGEKGYDLNRGCLIILIEQIIRMDSLFSEINDLGKRIIKENNLSTKIFEKTIRNAEKKYKKAISMQY